MQCFHLLAATAIGLILIGLLLSAIALTGTLALCCEVRGYGMIVSFWLIKFSVNKYLLNFLLSVSYRYRSPQRCRTGSHYLPICHSRKRKLSVAPSFSKLRIKFEVNGKLI